MYQYKCVCMSVCIIRFVYLRILRVFLSIYPLNKRALDSICIFWLLALSSWVDRQVNGLEVAALIHTACHVSFISATLVGELSMRQDVIPDTSVPPSPLSSGTPLAFIYSFFCLTVIITLFISPTVLNSILNHFGFWQWQYICSWCFFYQVRECPGW